jgi:hypothetical protein
VKKGLKTINNYKIIKLIGQGTYSKVKLGLDLVHNKEIVSLINEDRLLKSLINSFYPKKRKITLRTKTEI